jgi:hypothetical protein
VPPAVCCPLLAGALDPSSGVVRGLLGDGGEDAGLELTVVRREVEVTLGRADLTKPCPIARLEEIFEILRMTDESVEVVSDDHRDGTGFDVTKQTRIRGSTPRAICRLIVVLVHRCVRADDLSTIDQLPLDTNPLTLGVMANPHVDGCSHVPECIPRRDALSQQAHEQAPRETAHR